MDELIKTLPSLGIGGILAGIMFYFYMQHSQQAIQTWKGQSEILVRVVQENTSSNVTLAVLIKSLHDHLITAKQINDRRDRE